MSLRAVVTCPVLAVSSIVLAVQLLSRARGSTSGH